MACLLAVLYNGLFAYSGSWGPFGGWCNAQTQSSVGHGSSPAWDTSF